MTRIAMIGLGNMGAPMARNLLKAGFELSVFDLNADALAQLTAQGASSAASIAELLHAAPDVVLSMLPAAAHVERVYMGAEGVLAHLTRPTLLIDSSTIDPQTARRVADQATQQGHAMVDAPVSGGTAGAAAGTLTFMVGAADADTFARVQPILEAMGKNIVHCGGVGTGQVAKVANNLLLAISMIGLSEAMTLGVALGMDAKVLAQVINMSSGRCWSSEVYHPYPTVMDNVPASRGYQGGFASQLMLKDLGLAHQSAKHVGQPLLLGGLAEQLYQQFVLNGHGQLDFSAIIQAYQSTKQ